MSCRQCIGIEQTFNQKNARKELKKYQRKGPKKTTKFLIDFLKEHDIVGYSLLDIGGGIGEIQHELLKSGISNVINVDASLAYINIVKEEADSRGYKDKIQFHHGNFIDLEKAVPNADIVTLERVICCYPDMVELIECSLIHTNRWYGIIYPRDNKILKIGFGFINGILKLLRNDFRIFLHNGEKIQTIIRSKDFKRKFSKKSGLWCIEIYEKEINKDNLQI